MKALTASRLARLRRNGQRRNNTGQIKDASTLPQADATPPRVTNDSVGWGIWILLAALTLAVIEGALRKWLILSEGGAWKYAAYFSKDVVFAGLLVLSARGVAREPAQLFGRWLWAGGMLLLIGAAISAGQGFNPVGAALTLRATLVLPLLALLAVPRLKDIPLRWVGWLITVFAVLNFALGVVQNRFPADHVLNRYAADTEVIVAVESGVRATGTFSYITGMTVMSSVGIWAGMVLLSLAGNHWQRLGGWAAIVGGFGCGLASVSRGPVVIAAAVVCYWVLFSRASISVLARSVVAGLLLLSMLAAFEVVPILSRLGQGLHERQLAAGDSFQERAFGQFGEAVLALGVAPFGRGLGTEQVGGNYYATGERSFTNFETQMPRLVMETGALGLAGFLVVCLGALYALQTAKREARSDGMKAMFLATQLLLLTTFCTNIVYNHTASAFVWMIFAAVMAMTIPKGIPGHQKRTQKKSRRSFGRRAGAAA